MKKIKKIRIVLYVFIICVSLQILAYCIPQQPIMQSVIASAWQTSNGGDYSLSKGVLSMQMDVFTDSWMLDIASYSGEGSALKKAAGNYYYDFSEIETDGIVGPYLALDELAKGNYSMNIGSYARYWHGYLFFLKAALCIGMTYADIKMLNLVVMSILLFYLFYLVAQKEKKMYVPLAFWILTMGPASFFCLAYSGVMYITTIACIVLIKGNFDKKENIDIYLLFIVIGMLTSWIDILSFPLITLGIPLIFCISLDKTTKDKNIFVKLILISICWGIGYAGMWSMKWLLSSIALHQNIIMNAISSAKVRSSFVTDGTQQIFTIWDVIKSSLKILLTIPCVLTCLVGGVAGIIYFAKNKLYIEKEKMIACFLVALFPLMWCVAFSNHTYMHYFTFRIWSISVYGILSMLYCVGEKKKKDI